MCVKYKFLIFHIRVFVCNLVVSSPSSSFYLHAKKNLFNRNKLLFCKTENSKHKKKYIVETVKRKAVASVSS